jgi:hypothetical protein
MVDVPVEAPPENKVEAKMEAFVQFIHLIINKSGSSGSVEAK